MEMDAKNMTNAELQLQLKTLENKYEALKNKIIQMCAELEEIDSEYIKINDEIKQRQNGIY